MRDFVLYHRTGRTDGRFRELRSAGRLDIVYQCILMGLFVSHGLRRDVRFHAILNGPPRPPLHVEIDGSVLRDVRVDEGTWQEILRKALTGGLHPGIDVKPQSFQSVVGTKDHVYVLHERGESLSTIALPDDPVFVLGDHVGLPKKEEEFALRRGTRVSLGKVSYLAASTVGIINYILDLRQQAGTAPRPVRPRPPSA